ncbi:MAG TPA: hypothetical protein VMJ66_11115 [Geobacteraceae bacterium]|nr:hypothetical protein [Geobacteraceae bacterium]
MSFILKALKKLETEKAARSSAQVEINMAIIAPETARLTGPARTGRWAVVPVLLLACAGLVYLFVYRPSFPANEAGKALPTPVATSAPPPPPMQVAAPAQVTAPPPQTIAPPASPANHVRDASVTGPSAVSPVPLQPKAEGRKQASARLRGGASPRSEPEPMTLSYGGSPSLTVSGIAYQDNPADSMAVVNGALVKMGMSVSGARVERIFMDRVRFRGSGGTFEVPLAR